MTLDDIVKIAIPDEPKDCRLIKASKEARRLKVKQMIVALIAANFAPKKTNQ